MRSKRATSAATKETSAPARELSAIPAMRNCSAWRSRVCMKSRAALACGCEHPARFPTIPDTAPARTGENKTTSDPTSVIVDAREVPCAQATAQRQPAARIQRAWLVVEPDLVEQGALPGEVGERRGGQQDDPIPGMVTPDRGERPQRLDEIAERAELDDQNATRAVRHRAPNRFNVSRRIRAADAGCRQGENLAVDLEGLVAHHLLGKIADDVVGGQAARSRRSPSVSASARPIASPSAAASPGGTSQPVRPSMMLSFAPP